MEAKEILSKLIDFNVETDIYNTKSKNDVVELFDKLLNVDGEENRTNIIEFLKELFSQIEKIAEKRGLLADEEDKYKDEEGDEEEDNGETEDSEKEEDGEGDDQSSDDKSVEGDEEADDENNDEEKKESTQLDNVFEESKKVYRQQANRYLID